MYFLEHVESRRDVMYSARDAVRCRNWHPDAGGRGCRRWRGKAAPRHKSEMISVAGNAWCTVCGFFVSRLEWRSQWQVVLKHERHAGMCQVTRAHTLSAVVARANMYVMPSWCLGWFSVARHGRTKTPPCRLRANRVPFNLTRRLLPAAGDPRTVTWQSDAVERGHRKPDPRARRSRERADNKFGTWRLPCHATLQSHSPCSSPPHPAASLFADSPKDAPGPFL